MHVWQVNTFPTWSDLMVTKRQKIPSALEQCINGSMELLSEDLTKETLEHMEVCACVYMYTSYGICCVCVCVCVCVYVSV